MPWEIQFKKGIWLPQIGWWLDAQKPVERAFVSHAHTDHFARHKEIVATGPTARLMRARLPGRRVEHLLPFGQTEQLTTDTTVTLLPAGHIFGSALCLLDHADYGRLLYTGDFKLRSGLSAEPCAPPQADTLIMETTFGRPQYVFPPIEQVRADIVGFCQRTLAEGATPVFYAYGLGKSQELLCILGAAGLHVMLHAETFRLTKICRELGLVLPACREFSTSELPGHVIICPPQSQHSAFLRRIPAPRTAMVSGWALDRATIYRQRCNAAFPLSDHADFPELLSFIERVRPKRVLTLHGFAADFAQQLRQRGIEAWALSEHNQLEFSLIGPSLPAKPPQHLGDKPFAT
jgi:Cft2 family RNA processing exonuclease